METNKKIETYCGCDDKIKLATEIGDFVVNLPCDENLMECTIVAGRGKDGKLVYNIKYTTFVGNLDLLFAGK